MTKLQKELNALEPGATFYLNIINCTVAEIEYFKKGIRNGLFEPVDDTLALFKPNLHEMVKNGEILAPQGFYRKVCKL